MLKWNELDPEIMADDICVAFSDFDWAVALRAMVSYLHGNRIFILRDCHDSIYRHVSSDNKEVGGLLLGKIFVKNPKSALLNHPLLIIKNIMPSREYRNSSVSLEMGTEIWLRINDILSQGNIVLGWYHSHPNLGCFFSGRDKRTQMAFFSHGYSMGWVIDPSRNEHKVFCGPYSEEYSREIVILG